MGVRTGLDPEQWETQLRRGSLDLAVLASLWEKPCYGLEIIDRLDSSVGLSVPEGTIYPLLSRLEGRGLVTSRWNAGASPRPRKYYSLSPAGRSRAREMKKICLSHVRSLVELVESIEETVR